MNAKLAPQFQVRTLVGSSKRRALSIWQCGMSACQVKASRLTVDVGYVSLLPLCLCGSFLSSRQIVLAKNIEPQRHRGHRVESSRSRFAGFNLTGAAAKIGRKGGLPSCRFAIYLL
jgi:hypothetical protein